METYYNVICDKEFEDEDLPLSYTLAYRVSDTQDWTSASRSEYICYLENPLDISFVVHIIGLHTSVTFN